MPSRDGVIDLVGVSSHSRTSTSVAKPSTSQSGFFRDKLFIMPRRNGFIQPTILIILVLGLITILYLVNFTVTTIRSKASEENPSAYTEKYDTQSYPTNQIGYSFNFYNPNVQISQSGLDFLVENYGDSKFYAESEEDKNKTDFRIKLNKIINRSVLANFNPAFPLAIFMSDGISFGVLSKSGDYNNNFDTALDNFLDYYKQNNTHPIPDKCQPIDTIDKFFNCHCGPNLDEIAKKQGKEFYICNNGGNQVYPGTVYYFYNILVDNNSEGASIGQLNDPWKCWYKNGTRIIEENGAAFCSSD